MLNFVKPFVPCTSILLATVAFSTAGLPLSRSSPKPSLAIAQGGSTYQLPTTNFSEPGNVKVDDISAGTVKNVTKIKGTFCNHTGRLMGDLTLVMPKAKNKSNGSGKFDVNGPNPGTSQVGTGGWNDANEYARIEFTNPLPNAACFEYELSGIEIPPGTSMTSVFLEPSQSNQVGGSLVHFDMIGKFELDSLRNLTRRATPCLANPAAVAALVNGESTRALSSVEGTLAVIGSPNAAITAVGVWLPNGEALTGVTTTHSGLDFTVSFPELPAGIEVDVGVMLSGEVLGRALRFDLEATHAP